MAKVGTKFEKEPPNFVHQNAILCETIHKEQRHQKLYTNYSVNPFKKRGSLKQTESKAECALKRLTTGFSIKNVHALTGKPNSTHDTEEGEEDAHFKQVIARANLEPVKKYIHPQTEAQEVGWITRPLLDCDRSDRRLHFYRQNTPITKYMDAAWRVKEQTENLN